MQKLLDKSPWNFFGQASCSAVVRRNSMLANAFTDAWENHPLAVSPGGARQPIVNSSGAGTVPPTTPV